MVIRVGTTDNVVDHKFPECGKHPSEIIQWISSVKNVTIQTYSLDIIEYVNDNMLHCSIYINDKIATLDEAIIYLTKG